MTNPVPGLFQGKWEGEILETRLSPDNLCAGSQGLLVESTAGAWRRRVSSEGVVETLCLLKNCDDNIETEVFLNPCFGFLSFLCRF